MNTIINLIQKLHTQQVQFNGLNIIRVPATNTAQEYFIAAVTNQGRVKVETTNRTDGSWLPLAAISVQAQNMLQARLAALLKKQKPQSIADRPLQRVIAA